MPVSSLEVYSGGDVRDQDGRMVFAVATGGGKPLQFAAISTAAAGATQLVAAPGAGLRVKVASYTIVASGAVTAKFQSATTDLTGAMALAANGGVSAGGQTASHVLECAANQAFNINLGGAVQVSGHISYFVE